MEGIKFEYHSELEALFNITVSWISGKRGVHSFLKKGNKSHDTVPLGKNNKVLRNSKAAITSLGIIRYSIRTLTLFKI
jgi:hypothetical protein